MAPYFWNDRLLFFGMGGYILLESVATLDWNMYVGQPQLQFKMWIDWINESLYKNNFNDEIGKYNDLPDKVKGKEEAVSVFEILDGEPEEIRELKLRTQTDFERGLLHYHSQEFVQAKAYFQKAITVNPVDRASQLYLRRVENFIEYGVPPDWEGIAILTEKY